MHTVEELVFAQKYPFSGMARMVLKEKNLALDDISREVIARARALIIASNGRKPYKPEIMASKGLLEDEVIAFPVAKILLSIINDNEIYRKFSNSISKLTISHLESEKNEKLLGLGSDLGIEFSLSEKEGFFTEIPLFKFLSVSFNEDFMKLVNMGLDNGVLHLTKNDSIRFIAAVFSTGIFESLPVETGDVPLGMKQTAKQIGAELKERRAVFTEMNFGSIKPDFFPPCIKELYGKASEGKNLNHLERFTLATFLVAVGMQQSQVIGIFSKTPNFKEGTTKYQVNSIVRKGISPPSCAKIRSYKICNDSCRGKHPVQYYRDRVFPKKKKR